ncbi:uncharacterized protein LOC128458553 [Pleuronectes platessa]|uniref:uncharacterized protein LOC128458553 n=1 Tax=Pleuronectes platessa TaxID=8262 RepID=UPI00232A3FE1|nr:uncharacterized protein LOC128458553 [Pleuronectes platessa]
MADTSMDCFQMTLLIPDWLSKLSDYAKHISVFVLFLTFCQDMWLFQLCPSQIGQSSNQDTSEKPQSQTVSVASLIFSPLFFFSLSTCVLELPPPLLSLTPDTRQMFSGECFTLQCLTSQTNSSGWKVVHFSPDLKAGTSNLTVHYSPPGGSMSPYKSEAFVFTATSGTSGVYWCEGTRGRSNAVNITVSYGDIILKTQASPVFTADDVTLCCQYQSGKHKQTSFFKNGALIDSNSLSGSDRVIKMTLKNVTREDEGFYRCASQDRQLQSPESWLSVRPDRGKLHIRGDSSIHWFLEMDHCFMSGSPSDSHSFDCLARLSLQVPEVLHLELLASFRTGSSSRGASCHQVGCDGGAVGPVLDGDVQPVGKGFLLWHLKGNSLLKPGESINYWVKPMRKLSQCCNL